MSPPGELLIFWSCETGASGRAQTHALRSRPLIRYAASTVEEAVAATNLIGDDEVVIKSQILAGGRGLGTFTNGLQGGVHIIKSSKVEDYASKMLGGTLVTKQVRVPRLLLIYLYSV